MKSSMREIGLHLRLTTTLLDLYEHARMLGIDSFQCFFVSESTGAYYELTAEEAIACKAAGSIFKKRYLHGSYWINPAAARGSRLPAFKKEMAMAQQAGLTDMIVHPGSARGVANKKEAIDRLAYNLNDIYKKEYPVGLLVENAAHGGNALGGSFEDFFLLRTAVDQPERLKFCVDTAHAFSYGYSFATPDELEKFIDHLDAMIGINSIELIHLNNTYDKQGSRLDRHAPLLEGLIEEDVLRRFVMHERLKHIPVLLETPTLTDEAYRATVERVRSWHE